MYYLDIIGSTSEQTRIALMSEPEKLEQVDNNALLLQDKKYMIKFGYNIPDADVIIEVGESAKSMLYNHEEGCYVLEDNDKYIFSDCYDLTRIIIIIFNNGNKEIVYSPYIRVAVRKNYVSKVDIMLEQLERSYPDIIRICFENGDSQKETLKKQNRTIWNTVSLLDEIIAIFDDNFVQFNNYISATVIRSNGLVDVYAMRNIKQSSLRWIAENPNNLIDSTRQKRGFKVGQRYYMPKKVYSPINKSSTNTYENRIILGFLVYLMKYIEERVNKFEVEGNNAVNIPLTIANKIPSDYDFTGRCVRIYYEKIINELKNRCDKVSELFYKYRRILDCEVEELFNLPKLTNVFKQVKHYRIAYEYMLKWFEEGDCFINNMEYIFSMSSLTKIFEYLCLVRINSSMERNGYKFISARKISYDEINHLNAINNKYEFDNGIYRVIVYYEPVIHVNKTYDEIELYCTGYNFEKNIDVPMWTPDYVIKVEDGCFSYYYVLDAKLSTLASVNQYHIKNLVLKYVNQIATKDKYFCDVIGAGAIFLENNLAQIYHYKSNLGSKESFPLIFSVDIGEEADTIFSDIIDSLINYISVLIKV